MTVSHGAPGGPGTGNTLVQKLAVTTGNVSWTKIGTGMLEFDDVTVTKGNVTVNKSSATPAGYALVKKLTVGEGDVAWGQTGGGDFELQTGKVTKGNVGFTHAGTGATLVTELTIGTGTSTGRRTGPAI